MYDLYQLYSETKDLHEFSLKDRVRNVKFMTRAKIIGSERAVDNTAFNFSITENCALLDINPEQYLAKVFTRPTSKEERDYRQLFSLLHQ